MGWKEYYQDHTMSAEEALKKIPDGGRVVFGHSAGEPEYLVDTLSDHPDWFKDVEICHMVSLGQNAYVAEGMQEHFRHNSWFASGGTSQAILDGRADYTPTFFFEVPKMMREYLPTDVALVSITPPDEKGLVSLGVSCDYTVEAVRSAKLVIAQVNDQMPWVYGDTVLPIYEFDCFVEHSEPLPESKPAKIGEVEEAIGKNCASLIQDGDTLQLGIGAIPDAVLAQLGDKKDLGIHSEMFSDGVVDLANAGVITNARKTLKPGKFVVTFLMGTKKLYDFADHNPAVEMGTVDYVNNPRIVCQNDDIVCINSAIQVDFMGQVCAEAIGPKQISGVGGQVDFVRGASMARNGRAIIAMPSTAAHGKISRIVPLLDKGAPVTTSRNDVDYVITEYGIAHLKGKTLRERALALIGISHPDFRDALMEQFETKSYLK